MGCLILVSDWNSVSWNLIWEPPSFNLVCLHLNDLHLIKCVSMTLTRVSSHSIYKKSAHNSWKVKDGFFRGATLVQLIGSPTLVQIDLSWNSQLITLSERLTSLRQLTYACTFLRTWNLSGEPSVVHLIICVRLHSQQRQLSLRAQWSWSPLHRFFSWTNN